MPWHIPRPAIRIAKIRTVVSVERRARSRNGSSQQQRQRRRQQTGTIPCAKPMMTKKQRNGARRMLSSLLFYFPRTLSSSDDSGMERIGNALRRLLFAQYATNDTKMRTNPVAPTFKEHRDGHGQALALLRSAFRGGSLLGVLRSPIVFVFSSPMLRMYACVLYRGVENFWFGFPFVAPSGLTARIGWSLLAH